MQLKCCQIRIRTQEPNLIRSEPNGQTQQTSPFREQNITLLFIAFGVIRTDYSSSFQYMELFMYCHLQLDTQVIHAELRSAQNKIKRKCTEMRFILCTWFGEFSSFSSLTVLPGSAWVLLKMICKDFISSLYVARAVVGGTGTVAEKTRERRLSCVT